MEGGNRQEGEVWEAANNHASKRPRVNIINKIKGGTRQKREGEQDTFMSTCARLVLIARVMKAACWAFAALQTRSR